MMDTEAYIGPLRTEWHSKLPADWSAQRLKSMCPLKFIAKERLAEQKQAVINQAVTRGLDPNVRLKASGVEWLGDVSSHWDVVRNGRLFAHRNETGFADLPCCASLLSLRSCKCGVDEIFNQAPSRSDLIAHTNHI